MIKERESKKYTMASQSGNNPAITFVRQRNAALSGVLTKAMQLQTHMVELHEYIISLERLVGEQQVLILQEPSNHDVGDQPMDLLLRPYYSTGGTQLEWSDFLDKYDVVYKLFIQVTEEMQMVIADFGLDKQVMLPTKEIVNLPALFQEANTQQGMSPFDQYAELFRTRQEPELFLEKQKLASLYDRKAKKSQAAKPSLQPVQTVISLWNGYVEEISKQIEEMVGQLFSAEEVRPEILPSHLDADEIYAAIDKGDRLEGS